MDEFSRVQYAESTPIAATIGFSVIVPSFNHARFIKETIDSLLGQHYPELEVIVVDGGSTDGTLDLLRGYGEQIRWISERDNGQSDAICKGFALATHEWLAWLNSDDIQTNNALHHVQQAILNTPGVQVVVGQGHYMDEAGAYLRPYPTIAINQGVDICRELFEKGYVAQPSVFFHRDAYRAIGGINRALQFVMDYDLWVRLAQHGCRFVAVAEDISGNRWHENAKTASQLLPLLAEAAAVQVREYTCVSAYFVQAISDHLYHVLHSRQYGDQHHLLYRSIYFKSIWVWFNIRRPLYCLWGLLTKPIAKSGPIVGDRLTTVELTRLLVRLLQRRYLHWKRV